MGGLAFPSLDQAIAGFENVNPSYNNPGAIMAGPFATAQGATGATSGGLALFPTPQLGQQAEDTLVSHYANSGYSLQDMINAWAPPSAGNPNNANYTGYVASKTGMDPNAPVASGAQTPGFWQSVMAGLGGGQGAAATLTGKSALTQPAGSGCGTFDFACRAGLSWGRVGAFLLGLICILGGIALFATTSFEGSPTMRAAAGAAVT